MKQEILESKISAAAQKTMQAAVLVDLNKPLVVARLDLPKVLSFFFSDAHTGLHVKDIKTNAETEIITFFKKHFI